MPCLPQSLEFSQMLSYFWAQWLEGLFRYELHMYASVDTVGFYAHMYLHMLFSDLLSQIRITLGVNLYALKVNCKV